MYSLTLTSSDRKAFDFVGYRYNTGNIADLLRVSMGKDEVWCDEGDITFHVPEHRAWDIRDLAEEDEWAFPCFASDLRDKMIDFCDSIV